MRVFERRARRAEPFVPLQQRSAGQSLRMRLFDLAPSSFVGITLSCSACVLASLHAAAPTLLPYALAAMGLWGAALFGPALMQMTRLAKGAQAEAHVGRFLDTLVRRGAYVLHDVCGDGFNIDHVVIAPSGVFVIETKWVSKARQHGRQVIACRNGVLTRNGRIMRGDALGQVTRATEEVRRMTRALGYTPVLQPVLVFPGWWTRSEGPVWVLNERAALRWIARAPAVMSAGEARRLYLALRMPAVAAA